MHICNISNVTSLTLLQNTIIFLLLSPAAICVLIEYGRFFRTIEYQRNVDSKRAKNTLWVAPALSEIICVQKSAEWETSCKRNQLSIKPSGREASYQQTHLHEKPAVNKTACNINQLSTKPSVWETSSQQYNLQRNQLSTKPVEKESSYHQNHLHKKPAVNKTGRNRNQLSTKPSARETSYQQKYLHEKPAVNKTGRKRIQLWMKAAVAWLRSEYLFWLNTR